MIDYDVIMSGITTLGFPIVVAGALFWYMIRKDEQHHEEMVCMKESLDKNTSLLDELKGLITYLVSDMKRKNGDE